MKCKVQQLNSMNWKRLNIPSNPTSNTMYTPYLFNPYMQYGQKFAGDIYTAIANSGTFGMTVGSTFSLRSAIPFVVDKIHFTNYTGDAWGVRAYGTVNVYTSNDGVNFSLFTTYNNTVSSGGATWTLDLDFPTVPAKEWLINVTSILNYAADSYNQALIDRMEIEAYHCFGEEVFPIRYTTQGGTTTIKMSNSNNTPPTPTPSEATVTNLSSNYDFGHIYCNGFETGNDYLATTDTGWTYAVSELSTSVTRLLVWTFDNPIQLTHWTYDTSATNSNWTISPYAYLNNQVVDLTGMNSSNPKIVDSVLLSYDVSAATPNMPIGCKKMTIKYLTGGN